MASVVPSGRSASAVFGNKAWAGAAVSFVVHGGFFAVFVWMILHGLVHENVYEEPQVSVVDFEVPEEEPEPEPPKPPTPPATPPEPQLVPHPAPQAIPHAAPPAPSVVAGAGHGGSGGDAMGVGTDTEWHGEQAAPEPAHDIPPPEPEHHRPPPPPPPPQPRELDDAELSVHPNIRCSSSRMAALYPQTAIDNDAEADIPVEVVVDSTGRVVSAHARSDPGFGLGGAAEQALLTACRPTAVPLDRDGNPAITRVVHTIHWQLE